MRRDRTWRVILATLALAACAGVGEAGYSVWGAVHGASTAQQNEAAAIAQLQAKDSQISQLEAQLSHLETAIAGLPAADRAAINAAVAQSSLGPARAVPPAAAAAPARGSGPAPTTTLPPTTTTTRPNPPPPPPPRPCLTVPVVGCLP